MFFMTLGKQEIYKIMILTVESYKDNMYILQVLSDILDDIKDSINTNPYKKININDWEISNKPIFKDGFESNIIFNNSVKNESINIIFSCIDELTEDDVKYKISGIVLYKEKGSKEQIIEVNNFIYNICNELLQLLEKNNEQI